jgi:hypothetical protein
MMAAQFEPNMVNVALLQGAELTVRRPLMVNTGAAGIMSRRNSRHRTPFLRKSAARKNPLNMISGPER